MRSPWEEGPLREIDKTYWTVNDAIKRFLLPAVSKGDVYWFSVNWKKLGWQLMSGCCFGYV